MQLKVLVDNNTLIDRYFLAEPAVCYLICDGDKKILFDVGYSNIFIQNAQKMNESLLDIDYLVLSHGHNDHTGGLVPLVKYYAEAKVEGIAYNNPTIIAHPAAFAYKTYAGDDIGSLLDSKSMARHFKTHLVSQPDWITDNLVFLGEIPRSNDFENSEPIGQCEHASSMVDDYVIDDSALAYKSPEGLVIITGCSHAGICNIIEYAKKVCDEQRIVDVIGGFHLLNPSEQQAQGTLQYFAEQNITNIHPCHCTSLHYKIALSQSAMQSTVQSATQSTTQPTTVSEVGVGLTLHF